MITDDEVMRLFEQADPARTTDDHNDTSDATGYLAALRTRSNNVTYIDTTETSTEQPNNRRWYMIGAAVAAVAIVVVGGLVLLTGNEDTTEPEVPATVPPTVAPTTAAAPPVEDAVGRATAFLASIEGRNFAVVEEQVADGFTLRGAFPGEPFGEPSTLDDLFGLRYDVAIGTRYPDPECSVVSQDSTATVVECETVMELVVHQFTNADGVSTTVGITLTDDGVIEMTTRFGRNFGSSDLRPFDEWVDENRPGVLDDDQDPQSPAELEPYTELQRTLAAEWAAFGVDAAEAVFADLNAGDLDAFLARLMVRTSFAPEDEIAASIANGTRYVASECTPDGMEARSLVVVCDVVVRDGSFATTGVEVSGEYRLVVGPDGLVGPTANTVDWSLMNDYRAAFEQWLAAAYPDVHGQLNWIDVEGNRVASAADQPVVAQYVGEFVEQSDVYPLGG